MRPLGQADRPAWLAFRRALWPDADPDELAREADAFDGFHPAVGEAVLIAESAGRPVGMVELSLRSHAEGCGTSPVGYLEAWYVEPGFRGRGAGRALVEAALAWARGRGCAEFASDAELANAASAAAHRALGFEEVCAIRCFRRDVPG